MQSISVKVDRVTFMNPETGFVVLRGLTNHQNVTTVGVLMDAMMTPNLVGAEYEFKGDWETTKYGRQFTFTQGRLLTNELFYFLTKVVKGIGEKLAHDLIECYGNEGLVQILENEPATLLEFKGIKEKKLLKIRASWEKQKELRELSSYLVPFGVSANLMIRIYNYYGKDSIQKVRGNPYSLTEIRGIGFRTADEIAQKLGVEFSSPFRIQAALRHALVKAAEEQGHTRLLLSMLHDNLRELIDTETDKIQDDAITEGLNTIAGLGEVVMDRDTVSLSSYNYMEKWLLSFFRERSLGQSKPIMDPADAKAYVGEIQNAMNVQFSPEQREIILRVATGKNLVYALAGYAGTGKSTISKAILDMLAERFCKSDDIVCCAFTGMASSRIKKLTGFPSYTIHTLLKYKGNNQFEYNKDNPLPYRVVLLDEASMVNLPLFYRLCQALRKDALFILVGDPAQLPPIGAGFVFGDILTKDFLSRTTLTTIFRQSEDSVLVHFANIIRQGEIPDAYNGRYADFAFQAQDIPGYFSLRKQLSEVEMKQKREENNELIKDKIVAIAKDMIANLQFPTWDFQVLTPMRRGILGTEAMNYILQDVFNPQGKNEVQVAGVRLRERDKVVHLQNKDMETTPLPDQLSAEFINGLGTAYFYKQRIFNGSVGIVLKIDHDDESFYVAYPGSLIVKYDFDHIKDLVDLAYCLTVHKAQGSQYKYVAIPLTNSQFMMLNNKWFYTAITRAEKKVFLIGQEYAFKRACTNVESQQRYTYIAADLV
jgi:exodeoxyribonuclease V alpha subunit